MKMNLSHNYYSLDECIDKDAVMDKMDKLQEDGALEYSIDMDIVKIEDIYLTELEIKELESIFYKNDVFPYLERKDESDNDLDEYFDNYDD